MAASNNTLVKKRELTRERQKRFRERQRERHTDMVNRMAELRQQIERLTLYLTAVADRTVLRPDRKTAVCSAILELYVDYFHFGVDPSDSAMYAKQTQFLAIHFQQSESILQR